MSELFVDNSSMSVDVSQDVARFSSDASDDATRRGVVAVGSAVELGSFIPLKPGKKQPSWSRKRVSVNADKTVNRSLLPSRPSAEAAAGGGEFTITSRGFSYFDLDFHDQASDTQRDSDRWAFLSLMRGLTGAARVYVSRTGSGGCHAPLLVPERLYDGFPLLWFVFGRTTAAHAAAGTVGGRALRAFAAEINDAVGVVMADRVDVSAGDKRTGVRADGARSVNDDCKHLGPDDALYNVIVPDNVLCGVSEGAALAALLDYTAAYARGDGEAMARAAGVFPAVGVLSDGAARRLSELVLRELMVPGMSLSDADVEIAARESVLEELPGAVRALVVSGGTSGKVAPWGLPVASGNVLKNAMRRLTIRVYALAGADEGAWSPSDLVATAEDARFALCDGFLNPLVWGEYAGDALSPVQRAVLVRGELRLSGVGELWEPVRSAVDPAAPFLSDEVLDEASADSVVMAAAEAGFPVLGGQRDVDAASGSDGASRERTLALACAESVRAANSAGGARARSFAAFKSRRSQVAGRGVGVVDALGMMRVVESLGWFNDTSARDVFTFSAKWADMIARATYAGRDGVDVARSWRFCTVTFAEAAAEGSLPFVDRVAWMLGRMGGSGAVVSYSGDDVLRAHRVIADEQADAARDVLFDGDASLVESVFRVVAGSAARVSAMLPRVRVRGVDGAVVAALDEAGDEARVVPVRFLSPAVVEAVCDRLIREGDANGVHDLLVGWALVVRRVLSRLFASDSEREGGAAAAGSAVSGDTAADEARFLLLASRKQSGYVELGARGEQGVLDYERALSLVRERVDAHTRSLAFVSRRSRDKAERLKRDADAMLQDLWILSLQGATERLSGNRERLRTLLREASEGAGDTRGATQSDKVVNERVKVTLRLLCDVGVLSLDKMQRAPIGGVGGRSSVYSIRSEYLCQDASVARALEVLRSTLVPLLSAKFAQGCALDVSVGEDGALRFGGRTLDEWDVLGGPWRESVQGRTSASRVAAGEHLFASRDRKVLDKLVAGFARAAGLTGGSSSAVGVARAAARCAAVSGRELFSHQVAICELAALAARGVEGVRVVAGVPTARVAQSRPSKSGASRQVETVRREVARDAWDGVKPGTPEYAQRTDQVFHNPQRTPSHQLKDGGRSAELRELYVPVVVLVAEDSPLLADERFARVMCQSFPATGERGIALFAPASLVDAGGAAAFATSSNRSRKYFETFAAAVAGTIAGGVGSGLELTLGVRSMFSQLCAARDSIEALDGGYILAGSSDEAEATLASVSERVAGLSERVLELAAVGFNEARPGLAKFVTDNERKRLDGLSEGERAAEAAKRLNGLASVVDSLGEYAPDGVNSDEWVARLLAAAVVAWSSSVTSRMARADGNAVCALLLRVLSGVSAASTGGGVGVVPEPVGWVLRA
jgi:hypothetical protein